MNVLEHLIQVFLSPSPVDDWLPRVDMALVAIASVAAVVWTGGLVSYQLKQYTVARSVGLEIVQASFIGSVFALFMQPVTLRIVVTVFTVYYVSMFLYALFVQYRDVTATRKTHKEIVDKLSDDDVIVLWKTTRRYIFYSLLSMILYVCVIVWPYPKEVAWIASVALYVGLQAIMSHLNTAPDRGSSEASKIGWRTTLMGQLQTLISQVGTILQKLDGNDHE